jgi:hypothetical protein
LLVLSGFMLFAAPSLVAHHLSAVTNAPFFKNFWAANQEIALSFQPSGIEASMADTRSDVGWAVVKRIIETRTYLFLAVSKREAFVVPRRVFASDDAYQAARNFIASQVGPTVPAVRIP